MRGENRDQGDQGSKEMRDGESLTHLFGPNVRAMIASASFAMHCVFACMTFTTLHDT